MTNPARSRTSAGLLMFRQRDGVLEFLLVHPGGPLWSNRDEGAWSIPKGEAAAGEDLLERARKEFEEELGLPAPAKCFPLGSIKQKGGKTVHAWAVEGDLPADFLCSSNSFEMEWPPRSGNARVSRRSIALNSSPMRLRGERSTRQRPRYSIACERYWSDRPNDRQTAQVADRKRAGLTKECLPKAAWLWPRTG